MPDLQPLIISAPFGNYVRPPGATPTLGTFTALPRPGRLWRIVRTVRYSPSTGAWVNRIGLRNPGIDWLARRVARGRENVSGALVSIHGFDDGEWAALLDKAAMLQPLGIELNMSCPNVGHVNWPQWLFSRAAVTAESAGILLVVKLPPVNYREIVEQSLEGGVRWFHCCNTLPVPAGGISGKPLKPVALQCVRDIVARSSSAGARIIGGGGITTPADIDEYADAGAARFAVGTRCFNPWLLVSPGPLRAIARRAAERARRADGARG